MVNEKSALIGLFKDFGTLHEFKKNAMVFSKGDSATVAYLIEDGLLKICQLTSTGQDVTFFIRKTGEYFGMAEIVLGENHPCFAQCLRNSRIWTLSSSIIQERIQSDPVISGEVLRTLTSRLMQQEHMVEQLVSKSVSARLAWLINQLCREDPEGRWSARHLLTHEELSNIVGCSRQSISEIFNEWRARGIICYTRNSLTVIRPDHLIEYI